MTWLYHALPLSGAMSSSRHSRRSNRLTENTNHGRHHAAAIWQASGRTSRHSMFSLSVRSTSQPPKQSPSTKRRSRRKRSEQAPKMGKGRCSRSPAEARYRSRTGPFLRLLAYRGYLIKAVPQQEAHAPRPLFWLVRGGPHQPRPLNVLRDLAAVGHSCIQELARCWYVNRYDCAA